MTSVRADIAAAKGGTSAGRARGMLAANARLNAAAGSDLTTSPAFTILLFLAAEDEGAGVTTSRCCGAVQVPRTTALRWITSLAASGFIEQSDDGRDGRVTLLRLTPGIAAPLAAWLEEVASL